MSTGSHDVTAKLFKSIDEELSIKSIEFHLVVSKPDPEPTKKQILESDILLTKYFILSLGK